MSSVSGGTIPATLYALYGNDFDDFNRRLNTVHTEDNLIEKVHRTIKRGEVGVPSGRENVITGFAEVYDRDLFDRKKFAAMWSTNRPAHLKSVIFNATEFKTATGFRFQYGGGLIGNGNVPVNRAMAKEIRMADILAASSCFPAGFEPLSLPHDFKLDKSTRLAISERIKKRVNADKENEAEYVDEIALMDGGIYDNQGIESVILANNRKRDDHTDLMLIVDVASAGQDLYDPPKYKKGLLSLFTLRGTLIFLSLCALIAWTLPTAVAVLGFLHIDSLADFLQWSTDLVLAALITYSFTHVLFTSIIATLIIRWFLLKRKLRKELPVALKYGLQIIKSRSLTQFIDMMKYRVGSVVAMASEIFLKRARSQVYEDAKGHDLLGKCAVTSLLTHFSAYSNQAVINVRNKRMPEVMALSLHNPQHKALIDVCNEATKMPTTLWFKNDKHLHPKLVAAGSIVLCYTLANHLHNMRDEDKQGWENDLLLRLTDLWPKFLNEHYCLIGKYGMGG